MEPLSSTYTDDELLSLIEWHTVDFYVGLASSLICLPTLLVFLSQRRFLVANKLLALLALGDLCTCAGILFVGVMRRQMYETAMETGRVPIETPWSCALKPFVVLRLLGSLIPPGIVLWIGVERFLAVYTPVLYRERIAKHTNVPFFAILLYIGTATGVAYTLAYVQSLFSDTAPFYCGRKVAFGRLYSTFMYAADVLGFTAALILNCATLGRLARLYRGRRNRSEVQKQLKRIRYIVVISAVSTLAVAIPNAVSLNATWFLNQKVELDIYLYLSEPSVWLLCLKSSINFFVYILLKGEFRHRVYELLGCLSVDDEEGGGVSGNNKPSQSMRDVSVLSPPIITLSPMTQETFKREFNLNLNDGARALRRTTRLAAAHASIAVNAIAAKFTRGVTTSNTGDGHADGESSLEVPKEDGKRPPAIKPYQNQSIHPLSASELGRGT